jgi:ferredoxin-NADP reductase
LPSTSAVGVDIAGQHLDVRLTAEDGSGSAHILDRALRRREPRPDQHRVRRGPRGVALPRRRAGARRVFEIRGPVGGYFTWAADEPGPLLLVAGGAGLVPLMSMLRHRAARTVAVQAHLLVSARSVDDVLYRDELETLKPRGGPRVARTYTRKWPPGWTGWSRRIDGAMLADVSPRQGAQRFVCGPTPFVEAFNDLLVAGGHDPRDVHGERFRPTGG